MDQRKPSGVIDTFWIRAYRHNEEPLSNEMEKVGKWLLFVPEEHLDACWKRIREATVGGQLGISAKTATSKENPLASKQGIKLICVYTENYDDTTDIFRVLIWLRRLGFTGRLNYKTNEATLEKGIVLTVVARSVSIPLLQVHTNCGEREEREQSVRSQQQKSHVPTVDNQWLFSSNSRKTT